MAGYGREILEDIIKNFLPEKFTRLFREKNRSFAPQNEELRQYDDGDFKNGLKLGEISFSASEKLIVCAFQASQPLSERSGKKNQYKKGKDILKDTQSDAGIFIFYDASGNFRFSLIYANYLGKRRDWSVFRRFTYFVSREFTNKTFLARIGGGDFSTIEKIREAFSVEKVTKEFYEDIANWYFWAVQSVTFPNDNEEENSKNISVIRLITRMIFIWFMREQGLVPKNLFEEESISTILEDLSPENSNYYQAILQNLFFATLSTKKDERKFRSEIRGYKGINPDQGNDSVFRYHELFKNSEILKDYFGEIPFLNGGLFECLDDRKKGIYVDGFTAVKKNQPTLPNFLFFSQEKKVDLNKAYGTQNKKYHIHGLLNILSSFNFTIDENSPDDQDIALDPELLGRVFENLLASFNPETSTTARKATGSYYTPREIVDYMVAESLKAYFETHLSAISDLDKKIEQLFSTGSEENPFDKSESKKIVELIESVRIVDPAVGSGAFPMGALNKLVFILNKVDPGNELWKQAQLSAAETIPDPRIKQDTKKRIEEFFKGKNADYGRKLYLIQKCIYGVDIQQIAVEIAKLRFFISLLVDEKIDRDHPDGNCGIEPLPNLDFKIMQGNSLISEFLGIDFDNGQEKQAVQCQVGLGFENEDDGLIKEFERKKIDYQNESDKDKKAKLKSEVEDLMIKLFETKLQKKYSELKPIEERAQSIPNLKTREEYIKTEKEKFSKKYGFDLQNIEKQLREFTSKKKTRPFFPWKLYFAEVFNKENPGFDVVIGNPPYFNINAIDKGFIKYLSERYKIIHTGYNDIVYYFIFLGIDLLKRTGCSVFITSNYFLGNEYADKLRRYLSKHASKIVNFKEHMVFDAASVHTCISISHKEPKSNDVIFYVATSDKQITSSNLENELKSFSIKRDELNSSWLIADQPDTIILENLKSGSVLLGDISIIEKGSTSGKNEIFTISCDFAKKMKLENSVLRKNIKNGDIGRYTICDRGNFLIYVDNDTHMDSFPKAFSYLKGHKDVLLKRNEVKLGLYPWYRFERPRNKAVFDSDEKIVVPYRAENNRFAYDNQQYFNDGGDIRAIVINNDQFNIKYVLGILNSKLIDWFYGFIGKPKGKVREYFNNPLSLIPIKNIPKNNQNPFIEIVNKILAITKSSDYLENPAKKEEIKEYEKQIDQMVYKLYDLTDEEIKVVENSGK
ncbi:Eco57I restriction-modification methylase domain-containing protein [Patescibacteria group bacterium]|nr:Eco57I restriction-modification methylase domain-containing protein [Patescibacteria group bacterium]MBU4098897.1 Eco57I restriction-modification methylase domain-containing protein [Patescibacteria group bacterium]